MDLSRGEYQDIGGVIGMPDAEDKENIQKIINQFNKEYPKVLNLATLRGRVELNETIGLKGDKWADYGIVEKETNRARLFELPEILHHRLEMYIPTLFRSRKHFAWFAENFPELRLTAKYAKRSGYSKSKE